MDLRARAASLVLAAAASILLTACPQNPPSSTTGQHGGPIPTNTIFMHGIVEADEPLNADVIVVLNRSSATVADLSQFGQSMGRYVGQDFRLDGGDKLDACLYSECATLREYGSSGLFGPWLEGYIARLSLTPNVPYVVSFTRPNQPSASNTQIALPEPFTIIAPVADQRFTDGSSIVVSWAPVGVENIVHTIMESQCFSAQHGNVGAIRIIRVDADRDGIETLPVAEMLNAVRTAGGNASNPVITRCDIYIEVVHTRNGIVDAAFRGGEAIGRYRQRLRVEYVAAQ